MVVVRVKKYRPIKVRTPKPKIKTFTRIHPDKKNGYQRVKKGVSEWIMSK
jgi:hypothetical protein